jgi:ABC-type glycerol-3-phosphate transport system permease component
MSDQLRLPTRNKQALTGRIVIYLLLGAGAAIMLFPLIWLVITSLKPLPDARAYPPIWFSWPPRWVNYRDTLDLQPFGRYFLNTTIITVSTVIGSLLSCSFIAYGFARLRFPGRDLMFTLLISTMMVPFIVRLIPLFIVYKHLGWINTYYPLIVPAFFGTPLYIFLLRQFFLTIPNDLAEAARLDGANELRIWWSIYMPLSGPALAVIGIFAFEQAWNDFLPPLIFLNDPDKFTAALGLSFMLSPSGAATEYWNLLMAAAAMTVAPMLLMFFAAQRFFVRGVVLTGIKG